MIFSDAGSDTSSAAEQTPRPLTGGAARQARYRAARCLRSIDVRAETMDRIGRLAAQTGRSTQEVLAHALDCLEERLHAEHPKSAAPRRKQMPAEASPVTPDLFAQEMS